MHKFSSRSAESAGLTGRATGLIFGTPSSSGSFSFDIEVLDSGVEMDTRTFTIVVDP